MESRKSTPSTKKNKHNTLRQVSANELTLNEPSRSVRFNMKSKNDQAKLVKYQNNVFEYRDDMEIRKHKNFRPAEVSVSSIEALGGIRPGFGVIAERNLEPNITFFIGAYSGERKKNEAEEDETSEYVFQITNEKKEMVEHIDGKKIRNWTAYLNHSQNPNVIADQINIEGKSYIVFKVCTPIKKGDQLLFNYGQDYIDKLKYSPFYFHPSDNDVSDQDKYLAQKENYASGLYRFDPGICKIFDIDANSQWLVPEIFQAIASGDVKKIKNFYKNNPYTELVAYACENNKLAPSNQQQHITPLMYACALGNPEMINLIIEHTRDVNRCTFCNGETALTMLLKSDAPKEVIEECGMSLLEWMTYPFIYDHHQLTVLHYAIEKGADKLLERLLDIAENEIKSDPFDLMFKRKENAPDFAGFDYCLLNNKFSTLKILLEKSVKSEIHLDGKLKDYLSEGKIFSDETLSLCDILQLIELRTLLQKLKLSECVARLENHIDISSTGVSESIETQDENENRITELTQTINTLREKLADQEKKLNQVEEEKIQAFSKMADEHFDDATKSESVEVKIHCLKKAIKLYNQCKSFYIEKLKTDNSIETITKKRELFMSVVYCYEALIPLVTDNKTKEKYSKKIIKQVSKMMEDNDSSHYKQMDFDFYDFNIYLFQHKQNLLKFGTLSGPDKEKLKEEIAEAALNITKLYKILCSEHGLEEEAFATNYARDNELAQDYLKKNKPLKRKIEHPALEKTSMFKRKKTSTEPQAKPDKAEQIESDQEEQLAFKRKKKTTQGTKRKKDESNREIETEEEDVGNPEPRFFKSLEPFIKKAPPKKTARKSTHLRTFIKLDKK